MINDAIEAEASTVTAQQMKNVPRILKLKFRLGYERSTKDNFDRNGQNVDNWLADVMTHAQNYYMHSTLQHQIILEVYFDSIFLT